MYSTLRRTLFGAPIEPCATICSLCSPPSPQFLSAALRHFPAPRWDNTRVKHAWEAIPDNWESLGIPSAGATINPHIALKPHLEKALVTALYEVSSPGHPKHVLSTTPLRTHVLTYGLHLSKEQVADLVMPHPHTLELIKSWLKYHDLPSPISLTHGGNWLTLTGVSVSKANNLLGASYQLYRHAETKEIITRTVGYSLPAALHEHVQTVAPTTYFASQRVSWQTPRNRSGSAAAGQVRAASGDLVMALLSRADDEAVTPPFLHWLYNSVTYVPAATDRNMLGIAGFSQEYPNPVDLTTFMDHFHGPETGATYTVLQVNNGEYHPDNPGIEASVDVQYTSGMAYPTSIVYYSIGNGPDGEDDPYLSWLDYMLNLDETDIPQTVSSSYANYEAQFPLDYARAVCDLFMQLGVRGVSVLIASRDYGVGETDCMTDGNVRFRPTFPASPWVTGIGGTLGYPETAAGLSGGGFSEYFKRPVYQDEAVATLATNITASISRGFPDIAAQSYDIAIILGDECYEGLDGTSCSTPIMAGITSLLNDYRISQGRHPLGFLNPWLYGIARAGLNDIISGSNPGCNTDGFSAVVGWDPVTGLGSPDFERLQHIANLLP
ncbi:subtilisin-like protein [Lactarius vividus]|nr:subtilisin-like protein [Lactarius vividus]